MVLLRFSIVSLLRTVSGLITSLPWDQAPANATSTLANISSVSSLFSAQDSTPMQYCG
jgi:hypothetical protein